MFCEKKNISNVTGSIPDHKIHGANMGPIWVLSPPDGPHVGSMSLAIRDIQHHEATSHFYTPQCIDNKNIDM